MKRKKKTQYMTVFSFYRGPCSTHKTLAAAKKAAAACERGDGAKHSIWKRVSS
jgi:hypothetical protein